MALIHKKLSKSKQIKLTLALLLIIGSTFLVAYYGLLRTPEAEEQYYVADQEIVFKENMSEKSSFEQALTIVQNSIFKKLQQFGTWPLKIDPKGRPQPFIEKEEE